MWLKPLRGSLSDGARQNTVLGKHNVSNFLGGWTVLCDLFIYLPIQLASSQMSEVAHSLLLNSISQCLLWCGVENIL